MWVSQGRGRARPVGVRTCPPAYQCPRKHHGSCPPADSLEHPGQRSVAHYGATRTPGYSILRPLDRPAELGYHSGSSSPSQKETGEGPQGAVAWSPDGLGYRRRRLRGAITIVGTRALRATPLVQYPRGGAHTPAVPQWWFPMDACVNASVPQLCLRLVREAGTPPRRCQCPR